MQFTNAILSGTSMETLGTWDLSPNPMKSNCLIGFISLRHFTDWIKELSDHTNNTNASYDAVNRVWIGTQFEELVCICIKEDNDTTSSTTVMCLIRKGTHRARFKEFLQMSQATKGCSAVLYPSLKQVNTFCKFAHVVQANEMLHPHVSTTSVVCSSVHTVEALREIIDKAGTQMQ